MSKLKVCVYAICKNEASFVEAWVKSMNEADLIVVTDTGSTDDTVKTLEDHGVIVYTEKISPWRFDVARNLSLDHVPHDVDICVCTDLDELFEPGWREKLEQAWLEHKPVHKGEISKTGRYLYNWSLKPDGTPDVQFYYFKVHERKGFRWKCPIHEYVEYVGQAPLEAVYINGMVLNHYPDASKSRSSYLPLLEMAVKEDPMDKRMWYYLGREYMFKSEWQKCIDTLLIYLNLPHSTWVDERSAAMRWIAKAFYKLEKIQEAYSWYFRAIAETMYMRDPYIEFAKMCYELKDWPTVFFLTKEALKIKEKSRAFVNAGYAWDYTPDDLCAIAAYRMNMLETSLQHATRALEFSPNSERLKNNLMLIKQAIEKK